MTSFFKLFQEYRSYYRLLRQLIRPVSALPRVRSIEDLYQNYRSTPSKITAFRALDLGCGSKPRNPFQASEWYGIDLREIPEKM